MDALLFVGGLTVGGAGGVGGRFVTRSVAGVVMVLDGVGGGVFPVN